MRIVFEKLERSLEIAEGEVSLLHVEDHALFARCATSLMMGYASGALEPAAFFDECNKELPVSSVLFVVGDLASFDLNDKRIISLAVKKMLASTIDSCSRLERANYQIEEILSEQIYQLAGDYVLSWDWDTGKYLKMAGFSVDASRDTSLFEKACHLLRIAADLFPEKVVGMVNLFSYLTQNQFELFSEQVRALSLKVLLVETDVTINTMHLQNSIHVDKNYLEY